MALNQGNGLAIRYCYQTQSRDFDYAHLRDILPVTMNDELERRLVPTKDEEVVCQTDPQNAP